MLLIRRVEERIKAEYGSVPSSQAIEAQFYPGATDIQAAAISVTEGARGRGLVPSTVKPFGGPF
jgi:hypothetical protein